MHVASDPCQNSPVLAGQDRAWSLSALLLILFIASTISDIRAYWLVSPFAAHEPWIEVPDHDLFKASSRETFFNAKRRLSPNASSDEHDDGKQTLLPTYWQTATAPTEDDRHFVFPSGPATLLRPVNSEPGNPRAPPASH